MTIARFEIVPCDGVVVYDCTVVRAPDGRFLFYGPKARNEATVLSLAPELRKQVILMTLHEVGIYDAEYADAA